MMVTDEDAQVLRDHGWVRRQHRVVRQWAPIDQFFIRVTRMHMVQGEFSYTIHLMPNAAGRWQVHREHTTHTGESPMGLTLGVVMDDPVALSNYLYVVGDGNIVDGVNRELSEMLDPGPIT